MAKNAKPDIEHLGPESPIIFESSSQYRVGDKPETLLDGDINKHDVHGVLLSTNCNSWIKFTVYETVRIYAYGEYYKDIAGETPHIVNICKVDENNASTTIGSSQTYLNKWYVLVDKLEKGKYMIAVKYGEDYSMFTEWYVEKLFNGKILLSENDKLYSIKNEFYDIDNKNYNPILIEPNKDSFERYGISTTNQLTDYVTINNETFRPIDKFNNPNILTLNYI